MMSLNRREDQLSMATEQLTGIEIHVFADNGRIGMAKMLAADRWEVHPEAGVSNRWGYCASADNAIRNLTKLRAKAECPSGDGTLVIPAAEDAGIAVPTVVRFIQTAAGVRQLLVDPEGSVSVSTPVSKVKSASSSGRDHAMVALETKSGSVYSCRLDKMDANNLSRLIAVKQQRAGVAVIDL
jgi:hypothetical protein